MWIPIISYFNPNGKVYLGFGSGIGRNYKFYNSHAEAMQHNSETKYAIEVEVSRKDLDQTFPTLITLWWGLMKF